MANWGAFIGGINQGGGKSSTSSIFDTISKVQQFKANELNLKEAEAKRKIADIELKNAESVQKVIESEGGAGSLKKAELEAAKEEEVRTREKHRAEMVSKKIDLYKKISNQMLDEIKKTGYSNVPTIKNNMKAAFGDTEVYIGDDKNGKPVMNKLSDIIDSLEFEKPTALRNASRFQMIKSTDPESGASKTVMIDTEGVLDPQAIDQYKGGMTASYNVWQHQRDTGQIPDTMSFPEWELREGVYDKGGKVAFKNAMEEWENGRQYRAARQAVKSEDPMIQLYGNAVYQGVISKHQDMQELAVLRAADRTIPHNNSAMRKDLDRRLSDYEARVIMTIDERARAAMGGIPEDEWGKMMKQMDEVQTGKRKSVDSKYRNLVSNPKGVTKAKELIPDVMKTGHEEDKPEKPKKTMTLDEARKTLGR